MKLLSLKNYPQEITGSLSVYSYVNKYWALCDSNVFEIIVNIVKTCLPVHCVHFIIKLYMYIILK